MASFGFNLVLVVSAVLIFFTTSGAALNCYACKSDFHQRCDHIDVKSTADEDCLHSVLVKAFPQFPNKYVCVIHKMEQKDDPSLNVVRGCAPEHYCDNFKDSIQCTTCESDLCNSSSAILPSIGLFISFIFLKYFI